MTGSKYIFTELYNGLLLDNINLIFDPNQINPDFSSNNINGELSTILTGFVSNQLISPNNISGILSSNLNGNFNVSANEKNNMWIVSGNIVDQLSSFNCIFESNISEQVSGNISGYLNAKAAGTLNNILAINISRLCFGKFN